MPLLVLGTTEFATEVAVLAEEAGYQVAGFVENLEPRSGGELEGRPVHWVDDLGALAATHHAVCGLGTTRRSVFVEQAASHGIPFATIVHPTAHVSSSSTVGEGSIVGAAVIVGAYTSIGRHVLLNRGSMVGHHTVVDDFASILPGANVAGSCRIGRAAYVAMSATVVDHTSVGDESVVGAGAVVLSDVPANVQVFGVPARVVKEGIRGR
jgi:acetyltransferase EpsM